MNLKIVLEGTALGNATDEAGRFLTRDMAVGAYILVACVAG